VHEERAILRFAKQDYAEAGREAQHAIDGGRASYFNHYLVAYGAIHDSDVSLDQGAPPEVLAHVLACIEANPSFEPGYVLLARIAVGGTDSKAEDLLLNAASRYGGSMQIQSTCALIAARRGDDIRAHACLAVAKALPGAEKSHNAKYLAGIEEAVARALDPMAVATRLTGTQPATELNLDTLDQAAPEVVQQFVADLDRALEHTKNPVLYYVRSRLKYRLNDIAGSLADITEAVRIAPNHWEYYSYSAEVRMRRRDFVGAIADIDAAEKLHPNFGPIYGQRGYAETMAAQLPAAIADFDRAIACEPNNAEYYTSRAFAKREKKDFDGALADLNHAIELDPKLARAYLIRAGIRSTKGDGKGALEDIGRSSTLRIEAAAASSH
jgi:tetratricopeptide (TPR) repeat protein